MIKAIGIDCINAIGNPEQDTDSLRKALNIGDAVPLRKSGPIDLLIGVDQLKRFVKGLANHCCQCWGVSTSQMLIP